MIATQAVTQELGRVWGRRVGTLAGREVADIDAEGQREEIELRGVGVLDARLDRLEPWHRRCP